MQLNKLIDKVFGFEMLDADEGLMLYNGLSVAELMQIGNYIKNKKFPGNKVGWIIDRNINITNICNSACHFCNFHRSPGSKEAYITSMEAYIKKTDELYKLGGRQLLLQGGLHPQLKLAFYVDLFKQLKAVYPDIKLHALGPPEIVHISKLEKKTYSFILEKLTEAGLDSLPGAGAEILSDRVRKIISKNKCSVQEWLDVMRDAHKLGIITSATMMFGHIETLEERLQHLVLIRDLQSEKPKESIGFIAFIPWVLCSCHTALIKKFPDIKSVSADEYIKMLAISRIMLLNIDNIQPSWLTVGKNTGQLCLHGGANDFGSVMIEENVVSSAGADHHFDPKGIQEAIIEAGFVPQQRNQKYEAFNAQAVVN